MERLTSFRGSLAFVVTALFSLTLFGCPSDPYDPQTHIDKLEDYREAHELETAVTELSRLKDPIAIKPLGKVWEKHNRWSKALRVIVELADQAEPTDEVKARRGDGPYWADAVPLLITAVEEFDPGDGRSIEDAVFAAEALGRSKAPEAVSVLISAARKKMVKLSPAQRVRIAAVRALGHFPKNPKAIETLILVLDTSIDDQPVNLNAAAAMSLGDTKSELAVEPLLKAVFVTPPIYPQARMALSNIGGPAIKPILSIFEGKHAELNKLSKELGFDTKCAEAMGPNTECKAPGALESKAAALLGDLRAREAVPALIKGLEREPMVTFFNPQNGAPGPPSHAAILNALLLIQDEKSVAPVRAYMQDSKTDDLVRPQAIAVYSMLTNEDDGLSYLGKIVKDDDQEEGIRQEAARAYGRLVHSKAQLEPLNFMVNRYLKQAEKKMADAKKASKKTDKTFLENDAKGYMAFVAFFREQVARAAPGIKCKEDPACYAKLLDMTFAELQKELALEGTEEMTKAQKNGLGVAVKERAMLELAKMGPKAESVFDQVLKHAATPERLIREPVLFAMARIPKKPCKKCVDRLNEVILDQESQSTLTSLTHDTKVARNYLVWATE